MNLSKPRVFRLTYTYFFVIVSLVMCLVSVILTFKLLTNDRCNCPLNTATISYATHSNRIYESGHKLAVLVPFRDRFEELLEFVPYMHNFLHNQNVNHDIFILNQVDAFRFNRASLINIGYLHTKANYDYIVMHDVDLLPLNKNLSYKYPKQPFHLAAPNLHPRYHYPKFIGGILLINREQFKQVNGLSNNYWGWGLEDDEFYVRLKDAKLNITRPEGVTTGTNDTFRHAHGKNRKRDMVKCYNQREVTRKRDRITGLHDVGYKRFEYKAMAIENVQFTLINIELSCNRNTTPWCDCASEKKI